MKHNGHCLIQDCRVEGMVWIRMCLFWGFCAVPFGFLQLVRGKMEHFNEQIPNIKTRNTVQSTTPMTTWPPRPRVISTRTWSSTRLSSSSVRHDLQTISCLSFELCASLMSSMLALSVSFRHWALFSIQLHLLLIHLQSLAVPPAQLLQHCVLRQKGDGINWRTPLLHRWWTQN